MKEVSKIKCPNCQQYFDVEDALSHQIEEEIKGKLSKEYMQKEQVLRQQQQEFEEKKKRENELFQERLNKEKDRLKLESAKEAEEKMAEKIKLLEGENLRRKHENSELKTKQLDLLEKEKELKEQKEEMELTIKRQLLEQEEVLKKKIQQTEQEKHLLKVRELEKQMEDQNKLIQEMQRKAEQGSMQLQGEVLELVLEEMLNARFPHDIIEEVGKGMRGADVIQTVVNSYQQVCGKIIFESKRTKNFTEGWIEKLKDDQRASGAQLAVLVTEVLPKEMTRFGQRDGVWICTFAEAESLVYVLRQLLIREFAAKATEENKGDKMELLYNYLVGGEFRQRVEAIVEGFTTMKTDIDREKRAMTRIWKEREKQIEKVITNTIDMYGSIKGIGGSAIQSVETLELPGSELEDDIDE